METPLYVGPIPGSEKLTPGTICTTTLREERLTGKPGKVGVVELTDLQQMVNVTVITQPHNLPGPFAGEPRDEQAHRDWVCVEYNRPLDATPFMPPEVQYGDIKRVGNYASTTPIGASTLLTPYLKLCNDPLSRACKLEDIFFDVASELRMFAENSCPAGLTNSVIAPRDVNAIRIQSVNNQIPTIGACCSTNTVDATGAPTGNAATQAAFANLYNNNNAANQTTYANAVALWVGLSVRFEQAVYLRAVAKLLSALEASPAGKAALFNEWLPVHEVYAAHTEATVTGWTLVSHAPKDVTNISKNAGIGTTTAPLDHLPRGATSSTASTSGFVRLMGGKETTTFPPFPVNIASSYLWAGHKVVPMVPGTNITHFAAELCKSATIASILAAVRGTMPNCTVASAIPRDQRWPLMAGFNAPRPINDVTVMASDLCMFNAAGRAPDATQVFEAARRATEVFERQIDRILTAQLTQAFINALMPALRPLVRRYIQHTRFCVYQIQLSIDQQRPAEPAEWHRIVRFSGQTVEKASESEAKRTRVGDYTRLHVIGMYCKQTSAQHPEIEYNILLTRFITRPCQNA
jgi:hypothetical protein